MRRTLILLFLVLAMPLHTAFAAERWETLPPTPTASPGTADRTRRAERDQAVLRRDRSGIAGRGAARRPRQFRLSRQPGSCAGRTSPRYRGGQPRTWAHHARRQPFGYDLMTDDVVALLDRLKIQKADIVGWSDGAIIGLDMAMRHPDRVGRIFAFGANTQTSGLRTGSTRTRLRRLHGARRQEYARLSPTPDQYDAFRTDRQDVGEPAELDRCATGHRSRRRSGRGWRP